MNCCPNCFIDEAFSFYVESLSDGASGTCDFCGSSNVPLYEVSNQCEFVDKFERMFDVIVPVNSVSPDRTIGMSGSLVEVFMSTWKVFSFSDKGLVSDFLNELFGSEEWFKTLLNTQVAVSPGKGEKPLEEYSMFGSADWGKFSKSIKHNSRYFTKLAHADILEDFMSVARTTWEREERLFRARIWNEESSPGETEFHEPPEDKASDGRMRPAGIPCIYTADSPETAAAEVRAGMHDVIAIATLRPLQDFEYIDLSALDDISPLEDIDCSRLVANRKHLSSIMTELTRPVRASDSVLDYIPFQYLSELMQQFGYRAIGYPSVMHRNGYNIACFAHFSEMFMVESIDKYRVDDLAYGLIET